MKTLSIIGNIGKSVDMKYTPQGKAVTEFSVAVNTGKGENKKTEWVKVVAWEKVAEILNEYATAGSKIFVSGSCTVEAWIDKNSSEARAQQVLTVREFEFLGGNKKEENTSY
jgi:single-strand DNA-binding protein